MKVEEKKWRRKTWWFARYFELAVPMTFMLYVGWNVALVGRGKVSIWSVLASILGFAYMGMLREIVEATWSRQATDWLMSIGHHLAHDEMANLKTMAEKPDLKLCRPWVLALATVMTILAFMKLSIWVVIARTVIGMMVGTLVISHFLLMRMHVGEEMELWQEKEHS